MEPKTLAFRQGNFLTPQARQAGILVGDAIVGFDGCPTPYDNVWSLTTVRAPWAAVARTAVEQLNDLLEGNPVPPVTILPVTLVPGQTA